MSDWAESKALLAVIRGDDPEARRLVAALNDPERDMLESACQRLGILCWEESCRQAKERSQR